MIKVQFANELAQAAENVANHTVELICGKGVNEIWRCTKDDRSIYGFDLVISRFGIAMYGDVDSLVFKVGSSYGIDFLARSAVDSYMISKLEPEYREKRELDEDALRHVLVTAGLGLLNEYFVSYFDEVPDTAVELPAWVVEGNTAVDLDVILEFMNEHANEQPHMKFESFRDEVDTLLEHHVHDGLDRVNLHLGECHEELNLGPDWYEYRISKHDSSLIQRLEMLRICALKIQEVKNAGCNAEEHA